MTGMLNALSTSVFVLPCDKQHRGTLQTDRYTRYLHEVTLETGDNKKHEPQTAGRLQLIH